MKHVEISSLVRTTSSFEEGGGCYVFGVASEGQRIVLRGRYLTGSKRLLAAVLSVGGFETSLSTFEAVYY